MEPPRPRHARAKALEDYFNSKDKTVDVSPDKYDTVEFVDSDPTAASSHQPPQHNKEADNSDGDFG